MYLQQALLGPQVVTSLDAAQQLQRKLIHLNISSDVHDGYGIALVSVWVGLLVWCRHDAFWWHTGWEPGRKRAVYAWHPLPEPGRAARRIAVRYAELRRAHPHSPLVAGVQP
ncbi:hypothetical protein ACWEPL_20265 [Nonomuraea sp. NPDC004186]|uniref:hypothetical protein n=1 Tax=Nonomuraea sp. NPDC049625 TaxID=3155775 RepID=UPI003439C3D6